VHLPPSKSRPKTASAALQPTNEWSFQAIGTAWWIGIYQAIDTTKLVQLQQHIAERIELFDRTYSRFRSDSLVTRMAHTAGSYQLPADAQKLFNLYAELYKISGGLVTPLIGQVLSDAGYDADYSLVPRKLTAPPAWEDVMSLNGQILTTNQPLLLDFGAAGKGYLVDIISDLLKAAGVRRFCVDASGDLYGNDLPQPLRIGLEHPADAGQVIGVASVQQGALCGSATNRRAWADYHHIMNPHTLQPVQTIQAVWVTAENTMLADALTTALFFVQHKELHTHFTFAHCVIYDDNSVQYSADFPAELFT
jgi:thiamine biosynthesis lipoprotein